MPAARKAFVNHIAPHAIALSLILPAFLFSWSWVANLTWPGDPDFYRDIAQAQVFADGQWTADAFYRGERLHYPPLAPATVAILAKLVAIPIPRLYVLGGLGLNLLAPLAFYALAVRLLGRLGAMLSLFSFLYLRAGPASLLGGYTPWLFASAFAQAFCFASFLLLLWALDRASTGRDLAVAAMIGLTFLAHLGPAVLLACVAPGLLFLELPWRDALRRLTIIGLGAVVVALPHLWILVGHYRLRFLNAEPGQWMTGFDAHWADLFRGSALLGLAGLLLFAVMRRQARPARLLAFWAVAAALLLGASAKTGFMVAPHHFLIYARTALDLGLGALGALLLGRYSSRPLLRAAVAATLLLLLLVLIWPSYRHSTLLPKDSEYARMRGQKQDEIVLYQWLRANTSRNDVILTSEPLSFEVVAPAGRRVVAVPSAWANPFVDNERRRGQQTEMLTALRRGHWLWFCELATRYGVTRLVQSASKEPWQLPTPHFRALESRPYEIYEWRSCPEPLATQ
jgi:hypothetical protein